MISSVILTSIHFETETDRVEGEVDEHPCHGCRQSHVGFGEEAFWKRTSIWILTWSRLGDDGSETCLLGLHLSFVLDEMGNPGHAHDCLVPNTSFSEVDWLLGL